MCGAEPVPLAAADRELARFGTLIPDGPAFRTGVSRRRASDGELQMLTSGSAGEHYLVGGVDGGRVTPDASRKRRFQA